MKADHLAVLEGLAECFEKRADACKKLNDDEVGRTKESPRLIAKATAYGHCAEMVLAALERVEGGEHG